MGADKLLATIRKANVPNAAAITREDAARWVQKWRARNPRIVAYWAQLDAAAVAAVRNPGMSFPCRSVIFQMRDGVLSLRLPSGRELSYPAPVIEPGRFGKQQMMFTDMEAGRRHGTQMYGGAWAENVTSAVARDLLVEAMKRLRAPATSWSCTPTTSMSRRCRSEKAARKSSSACSSRCRPGRRGCRSRRRCSSAIGSRRTEPRHPQVAGGWPQVQPVQPPPASPRTSEKALIIKILDLSAADAAGAAGVPEQKISRRA